MKTSDNSIDTALCPLCQQPNHCVRHADSTAQTCWCQQAHFSEQLLCKVPDHLHGKSCICKNCADKAAKLTIELQ